MRKDTVTTLKLSGLLLVLFLAYLFRGALIQPPAVDPNHTFNTERAYARLARILGDEIPHPVDSAANDGVIARLVTEVETLGFTPIFRDQFHCVEAWNSRRCARLQNIAFWVTEPGPNAVLLLSHHDSVPAGPGASDDGAGVAASLEIANVLKDRDLSRPLLVLITDGEELGLMGANMFVEDDPLAKMVGAVVNMEARGVSGLSALIQTSRPNGRDLKTLNTSTRLPAASSLNADIYELLPNDTDMTEFLGLDIDAANLAYAGDVAFYHTPGDTLANMDKRALFNLGAGGLAATETFLDQTGDEAETQLLYVDILGKFLVTMPIIVAGIILAVGGLLGLMLLWHVRASTVLWRIILVPLLALGLGAGLAIGANILVDMIRPERLFGSAYPIALRGLHASAALTGAMIIYTFMTRAGEAKALLGAAWLWTAVLGFIAFFTVQGAAIVFTPSMLFFAIASIAFLLDKSLTGYIFAGLGAVLFAMIALPLSALGESGLFIESSAPFAIIIVLLFAYSAPLTWPQESTLLRSFWLTLVGTLVTMVTFLIVSLMVPAYSANAPRGLNIVHIQSASFDETVWSVSGSQPVPDTFLAAAAFETGSLPVFGGPRQMAPAPKLPFQMSAVIIDDISVDETRTIILQISAPETDRLNLSLDAETDLSAITVNGVAIKKPASINNITCSGRSCRQLKIVLSFPIETETFLMDLLGYRFGLGTEGRQLVSARPDWTISRQRGDLRLQHQRIVIESAG